LKERNQKEVSEFIDFLTAEGYLLPTDGQYPVLTLTENAGNVLRGKEPVFRKEKVRIAQLVEDNELFELLRELRRELAEKEKVPTYVIFSDATLREMSASLPRNDNDLLQIKGIGERKLEAYGTDFLSVINAYCEEKDIERKHVPMMKVEKKSVSKSTKDSSHLVTYQMLQDGMEIEEIAQEREVSERTVESHLIKCDEEGHEIDWDQFIPSQYEEMIEKAVDEAESTRLTPIKELLPDEISYFMIRAFLQKNKEKVTKGEV